MPESGDSSPSKYSHQTFQKRQVNMKSLIQQVRSFSSTGNKVVMTVIFASAISIFSISSALADQDSGHGRGKRHDAHGHRERRGDRDDYGYRPGYGYRPMYQQPYIYAQPVFVPPPIYYPPQQSPGISLFFPLNIRHRYVPGDSKGSRINE